MKESCFHFQSICNIVAVEFVQLSRGIQIAAGETVLLRCSINKPVVDCEWSWSPSNSSQSSTTVKKFSPNNESDHDCSVRFKNILYEEEGLWTCGVRLTPDGILHEAPSAVITLLPPGWWFFIFRFTSTGCFVDLMHDLFLPSAKVSFVEAPEDTSVPIGTEATLRCVTNARVEKCAWTWKSFNDNNDAAVVVNEFSSKGDLGRDCSLSLPQVFDEQQGLWGCQVWLPSQNSMQPAPVVKLTVFELGKTNNKIVSSTDIILSNDYEREYYYDYK